MSIIVKPNTMSAGATIIASEHNANYDTIYLDYNGNITNSNLSGSAAIADSKLAQLTSPSKVSGAALTSLASITSGAGYIPAVNVSVLTSNLVSTGTGSILMATATTAKVANAGWITIYLSSGTSAYVPYWTTDKPA